MYKKWFLKHLKILSDLDVTGIRFDAMKHIAANELLQIFEKARSIIGTRKFFKFGYGEVCDANYSVLSPYNPVCNQSYFVILGSLYNCFAYGQSIKAMVAPKSIGNLSDLNFSVLHDHYPGISTTGIAPFYQDGNRNNPDNVLKSQLAISYLLAKRDGIPLIIRYEDEKDNISGIIARSIDFRSKMKIKDAPHEYIKALNDDVLLVARQFGFAVINKGNTDYKVPQSDIRSNPHLSFYIPNGTYKDKSGNSYNVPNLDLTVNGKN